MGCNNKESLIDNLNEKLKESEEKIIKMEKKIKALIEESKIKKKR